MPQAAPCPLCQETTDYRKVRFGLLSCDSCGLVVSPEIWTPEGIEVMEDEWFGEDWDPTSSSWTRMSDALKARRIYRRIRNAGIDRGSLLEIGFGSGSLLGLMKARGWDVLGCDLSQSVCERATKRWSVPTYCGDVANLPEDYRFDLVVMNHVLEHVHHPRAMLEIVSRHMKPNGLLYVAVPNISCWESRLSGWMGYQPYHVIYFSPETLHRTVSEAGFQVQTILTRAQFDCWFLSILGTLVPAWGGEKRKAKRAELHSRGGTSLLEHGYRASIAAFGLASWPFRRVQEAFGKGDEVLALARMPS